MPLSLDQIGSLIGKALTGALVLRDATLIKVTPGARVDGSLAEGTHATTVSYSCKAIDDPVTENDPATLTRRERNEIDVVRSSLPAGIVPEADDRITVLGETWEVVAVATDPARAIYTLTVAGA